ncbi:hypothetical protein BH23ACI1_BH23ACI1_12840 [soil metagenome]
MRSRAYGWGWAFLVVAVAVLPFASGLTSTRAFYVRDLSLYFWGRYLWLRREWSSGEFPLWDPYVGGGQPAYSDALHQMFLLPAVLLRLVGSEAFGFNVWVAAPYPFAAAGAWLFFARRFSPPAAALGAIAFAVCGPIVSSANFPNLSWSVAAMPWVLWAADRLAARATGRRVASLATIVACQAFAGEPVTQFMTLVLVSGFVLAVPPHEPDATLRRSLQRAWPVAGGVGLGLALAAVQLLPMTLAAHAAERADSITQEAWSLRPTAILETMWLHLFGNYLTTQSLTEVPWMPLMFTGREPFFFSLYFGVPLLGLALFGLGGTAPRRWRLFWLLSGLTGLVAAFGAYTPLHPIVRDHVPLIGSFRFPAKYIVVSAMALAAGVASGWDALPRRPAGADTRGLRRFTRARSVSVGFAALVALAVSGLAAACVLAPSAMASGFAAFAVAHGAHDGGSAATFMLETLPRGAAPTVVLSIAAATLLLAATSRRGWASVARVAVFVLITADLLVRAWGINPTVDPVHLAEPAWIAHTRAHPDARVYVGGKREGTLDPMDIDASRAFLNAPGLTGSASRAALSTQAAFYPSAWATREMLSYDLPVLWPRVFTTTSERFMNAPREERDRFLDRTGVRYRILPIRHSGGREPQMPIPYFLESFLFDWGPDIAPRVSVLTDARVVPEQDRQIDALFAPGWDSRTTVLIEREPEPAGMVRPAAEPAARIVDEISNRVAIEAGVPAGGGYLVFLDSYSPDWWVTVDGAPASIVRANGLFRAVRLNPGVHTVEFRYRPRALIGGAAVSALALVVTLILGGRRRRPDRTGHARPEGRADA